MNRPCPGALAAFGVPARRWATRTDLLSQLQIGRELLSRPGVSVQLRAVAAASNLSEYHFARLFREVYGEAPLTYHRRCLMEWARSELRTDRPIGDIAHEAGYSDLSAFGRAFRRETGVSPRAFRLSQDQPTGQETS